MSLLDDQVRCVDPAVLSLQEQVSFPPSPLPSPPSFPALPCPLPHFTLLPFPFLLPLHAHTARGRGGRVKKEEGSSERETICGVGHTLQQQPPFRRATGDVDPLCILNTHTVYTAGRRCRRSDASHRPPRHRRIHLTFCARRGRSAQRRQGPVEGRACPAVGFPRADFFSDRGSGCVGAPPHDAPVTLPRGCKFRLGMPCLHCHAQ